MRDYINILRGFLGDENHDPVTDTQVRCADRDCTLHDLRVAVDGS